MGQFNPLELLLPILLGCSIATSSSASDDRKTYIIHVDKTAKPAAFNTHHDWYMSTLASLLSPDDSSPPIHLYTYKHVMDGFSAVLSKSHLEQLEDLTSHTATFQESIGHPLTTHTPKFLGLNKQKGLWPAGKFGNDIIIGVLDTGIWPESESFHDHGMPPVPSRWRGVCETGVEFNSSHCNKKLIGARKFSQGMKQYGISINATYDYDSPRDYKGHGSHTSSTAAGSKVLKADYFGYAEGTASGMAPLARIAMYKVIYYTDGVDDSDAAATDVLAGMDQAIEDGVDIMSLSLGFFETPFFKNPIALGAFAAVRKGIMVVCAAGNGGPHGYTMFNGAPWLTTVAAGTVDREFAARVTLGDGLMTLTGKSFYPESLFVSRVPFYFGRGNRSKETCDYNSLDPKEVAGKFVFCDSNANERSSFTKLSQADYSSASGIAGAVGAIYSDDLIETYHPNDFYLPFVILNTKDGNLVKNYILNTTNATVSVEFQVTVLGNKPAPKVAYFSSRGPDRRSPWILKPDILAPGYEILAAWVPNRGFAAIGESDYLTTDYAVDSGTSMATPHVAGIAALLKSAHHDWSPAAIRSAIMTTADVTDNANGRIIDMTTEVAGTPLDFGAGHINPNKALDPGLVYDIEADDYINYICALNYTRQQIQIIAGTSNFSCDYPTLDLNYPSFMVILNKTNTTTSTFKRVLMNVADNSAVYNPVLEVPPGMKAVVQPQTISFQGKYSKAEFNLTVDINLEEAENAVPQSDYFGNYGFLTWYEVNGKHVVRSVVVSAIASAKNP